MSKEKARQWGEPLPNGVVADASEFGMSPEHFQAQVSQLTRRCAMSAAMAAILAPFVYGELQR